MVHDLINFITQVCFFIDGPDEPSFLLNPHKSSFYVGEDLTLLCSSDSNPPSNFTWTASNGLGTRVKNVSINVTVRVNNPQTMTIGCA